MRTRHIPSAEQGFIDYDMEPKLTISEIGTKLSEELRLSYEGMLSKIISQNPQIGKTLDNLSDNHELLVVNYSDPKTIQQRIGDIELINQKAVLNLPSRDVSVVEIRFPPVFALDVVNKDSELQDTKLALTKSMWGLRDEFEKKYNVDIQRINYIGEHDDTPMAGFYYLWLITPHGKMPAHFNEPEIVDNEYEV